MGTRFQLTFYAADAKIANRAAAAAFARIKRLDQILSDYKPDSELSRLSVAEPNRSIEAGDELWHVLSAAQKLARHSGGAFDITVGPLTKLWRRARRRKQLPPDDKLAAARASVGYRLLKLDSCRRTVRLTRAGMRLDLGGIAKGYAADEAVAVLRKHGISRTLVDAGGDLALGDPPPGKLGWKVAVATLRVDGGNKPREPAPSLVLSNVAVATSGDTEQFLEIDGRRYSHLIDPRTGDPLTTRRIVTVVANNCMAADSLASAVSVLGHKQGLALIDGMAETEALVEQATPGGTARFESSGFKSLGPNR